MAEVTKEDVVALRKEIHNMKSDILKGLNQRMTSHEMLEMEIHKKTTALLDRHDLALFGPDGLSGLGGHVKEIRTKVKVTSAIFGVIMSGGFLTVVYMIITTP